MILDLFEWLEGGSEAAAVEPWKPEPLTREQWPPDYRAVYAWRLKQLARMRADPNFLAGAKKYYSTHRVEFICHWLDTYNPRKPGRMKWMPFVLFQRQAEAVQFLEELERDQESGLIEKCRDMGLTWLAVSYSNTKWLFDDQSATGWGSRKEILVDKLGDPDSIFEKMRLQLRRMPKEFLPRGFNWREHSTFMKLINPENGAIVAGEAGDNIGRGGRKTIYFKDESAHYERPELVEAALGDNTNVQVDISSVNGMGNVFHRRRDNGVDWSPGLVIPAGKTRVLVIDWRDHPEKTQEWYDRRREKALAEGMLHIFRQEVDRDYAGAILNTIIDPEWIDAAVDAHEHIRWVDDDGMINIGLPDEMLGGDWAAALDVADGGRDLNALVKRQGIVLRSADDWGDRDPGVAARRVTVDCRQHPGIKVMYDSVGVGATVKSEFNRLIDDNVIDPYLFEFIAWSAGAKVLNPFARVIEDDDDSQLNRDFFGNLKAQGWWSLRGRFWRTFRNIKYGIISDPAEMISISSKIPKLLKLKKELAQPVRALNGMLKMIVDKTPDDMASPNLGDATMMCYFPLPSNYGPMVGSYGN